MTTENVSPEDQSDIDNYRNHPTIKTADITHYRDDEATHMNTDWLYSDMNREGSMTSTYAWIRLLTGPENTPDGVTLTPELRDEIAEDPETIEPSLDFLESVGAIARDGDSITFPNLIWGTPPEDED